MLRDQVDTAQSLYAFRGGWADSVGSTGTKKKQQDRRREIRFFNDPPLPRSTMILNLS